MVAAACCCSQRGPSNTAAHQGTSPSAGRGPGSSSTPTQKVPQAAEVSWDVEPGCNQPSELQLLGGKLGVEQGWMNPGQSMLMGRRRLHGRKSISLLAAPTAEMETGASRQAKGGVSGSAQPFLALPSPSGTSTGERPASRGRLGERGEAAGSAQSQQARGGATSETRGSWCLGPVCPPWQETAQRHPRNLPLLRKRRHNPATPSPASANHPPPPRRAPRPDLPPPSNQARLTRPWLPAEVLAVSEGSWTLGAPKPPPPACQGAGRPSLGSAVVKRVTAPAFGVSDATGPGLKQTGFGTQV